MKFRELSSNFGGFRLCLPGAAPTPAPRRIGEGFFLWSLNYFATVTQVTALPSVTLLMEPAPKW